MNIKDNQRAQATRNRIKEVFIEMLSFKAINQITVQEVCKKAEINRTTFYAHYDDIYDLMQKIETELWQGIKSVVGEKEYGSIKPLGPHTAFSERKLEKLLLFIYENSKIYKIYLNDSSFQQSIDNRITTMWDVDLETLLGNDKSKEEMLYQFEYFKAGMMGVIGKWLKTGCTESPKEMMQILKNCIRL